MVYCKTIGGRQVISRCKSIQMPDGSWISNPSEEQIAQAGWIEYIPPEVPIETRTEPDTAEIVEAVRKMLDSDTDRLSDAEALDVAALFPSWSSQIGKQLYVGKRYWYDGHLYKVIQAHIAQDNWTPDTAGSLFVMISIEEFPEWVQPQGAHDAYRVGDHVSHNGIHWNNTFDYNTYEPGVYGWEEMP